MSEWVESSYLGFWGISRLDTGLLYWWSAKIDRKEYKSRNTERERKEEGPTKLKIHCVMSAKDMVKDRRFVGITSVATLANVRSSH